jgi:uncharacterized lipoprotein YmbA
MRIALPLAAALALGASGCLSFGADPFEVRRYDLRPDPAPPPRAADASKAAPGAPLRTGSPATTEEALGAEMVQVEEPTVDAALDREELVWRRGVVESGAYASHLWARPPAQAVREALAAALVARGACAAAVTEPPLASPDYRLFVHLARCEEVSKGEVYSGALEVRVALRRATDGTEILRRTVAVEVAATVRNPMGVAEALSRALGTASSVVATAVAEALARERESAE